MKVYLPWAKDNLEATMNRTKKLNDAYNKKLKKHNDKLRVTNKPKYISKADREKAAAVEVETPAT